MQLTGLLITSPTLVIVPAPKGSGYENQFAVFEYLKKSFSYYPNETLYWLSYFKSPKSIADARREHPAYPYETLYAEVADLAENGFVISNEQPSSSVYRDFELNWKWDTTTALFHFTATDNDFYSEEETNAIQQEKLLNAEQPELFSLNRIDSFPLPAPDFEGEDKLWSVMTARRTNRTSTGHHISMKELARCLYSGLGISAQVKTPTGWLPLAMTPSGGARNPYEAYVIVRRGSDIAAGVYHYSAIEHSLAKVDGTIPNRLADSLAGQDWVDEMAATIVLVAVFDRTMWKYSDPNAYRVVLIEAGHIAQNIMLAATDLGLSACPTAAIRHSAMSSILEVSGINRVPLYALTLDIPKASSDEIRLVDRSNRRFAA